MELEELITQYKQIHRNMNKVEVSLPVIEPDKVFDDAPEDLINLDYRDLLNLYKKVQKIIRIKHKLQTYEVPETPISIEMAQKPGKPKKPEQLPEQPRQPGLGIEKPGRAPPVVRPLPPPPTVKKPTKEPGKKEEVLKLPEEKIKKPEVPISAKGEGMEEEEEKKLKVAVPYIDSHEEVRVETPKQLSIPPDETAKKKIEEVVKRYQQAGEVNKSDVRRRMIDLTRELFKEKSAERKAELKAEIVKLKKLMEQKEAGRKGAGIFEALVKDQEEDLNNTLSGIRDTFNTNLNKVENEYKQARLVIFGDPSLTAKADSLFSSDLESILSQMIRIIDAYSDYTMKVHVAELEHLKGFGGVDVGKIDKRIEYIRLNYPSKFDELKKAIISAVNKARSLSGPKPKPKALASEKKVGPAAPTPTPQAPPAEKPGPSVHAPPAQKKEEAGVGSKNVLDEIARMHEGELLHYLSSRDRRVFLSYVRGEISKDEAVKQARILLAKERGVSDTLIKTYWG